MDKLTEYSSIFEQVILKKSGSKCCDAICSERAYECDGCNIQEALNKLYELEHGEKVPKNGT